MRDRSLAILGDQIADSSIHVGGGSAAAAAASLAAASADLVITLSNRKSTPTSVSLKLAADHERLSALRGELLSAGGVDEDVLDELMHSYRKRSDDQADRLVAAAESSLVIARLAAEIVDIARANLDHASRFTVSDLGTAATLAASATEAALLNATINVTMLEESSVAPGIDIVQLRREIEHIQTRVGASAPSVLAAVWSRIDPTNQDGS